VVGEKHLGDNFEVKLKLYNSNVSASDSEIVTRLIELWKRLWQPLGVDVRGRDRVLQELFQAYSQSDRYYHNLTHINKVLELVYEWNSSELDFSSLQFAAWFHDVIYNPKASDNEAKSTEYAAIELAEIGILQETIDRVIFLILCTQFHQAPKDDLEAQILLDADLAVLGSDPSDYQAYARAIRREYSWLSESEYRSGRTRVLEHFLQRDRLYFTDKYYARFERKARQNIQEELVALNQQSSFNP
jgi:predicted metal-dependent HD superfamily phosphohydrolase